MKLIVRRKIAVKPDVAVQVTGLQIVPKWPDLTALVQSLSRDANADGLESGDVLVEVTDHG